MRMRFRWWYILNVWLFAALIACIQAPGEGNAAASLGLSEEALQALSHTSLYELYQQCGGRAYSGELLTGPLWWHNQWIMISRDRVFALDDTGVHLYTLNSPSTEIAEQENDPEHLVYEYGHNVPIAFKQYMQQSGGEACYGKPVGERFEMEKDVYCQQFEYATLCYDSNAEKERFFLQPLGQEFYQKYKGEWSLALPIMASAGEAPLQVSVERPDAHTLYLSVGKVPVQSAASESASLVVQVRDVYNGNDAGPVYYVNIIPLRALGDQPQWEEVLPLQDLPPGRHRLAFSACVLNQDQLTSCAEDVLQIEGNDR